MKLLRRKYQESDSQQAIGWAMPVLYWVLLLSMMLAAQTGITRSSSLGFRLGFWDIEENSFDIFVSDEVGNDFVNIGGAAFWLDYTSRVHDNWFWEFNMGFIGDVVVLDSIDNREYVDVEAVLPILVGLRYDLLSNRLPGKVQPYLTAGVGPYWSTDVNVVTQQNPIPGPVPFDTTSTTRTSSRVDLGGYVGTGLHFVFNSRLALKMDLKYHRPKMFDEDGVFDFGFGLSFMWGSRKELFRVKKTQVIVSDIYPAFHQFYSTYPLAMVSVQNTAGFPIEVNVRSRVRPYSSRMHESGFRRLKRGETKEIPVTAIFDPGISNVESREPAVLEIEVEGRANTTLRKAISEQVTVHTRNSWNGEVDKLSFFIASGDPQIVTMSREMTRDLPNDSLEGLSNLRAAEAVFNSLGSMDLRYQSDPNVPFYQDDRVQFPEETIRLGGGDCDDLVILYASLLESLGIRTAFVQVRDPEESIAHLYLLFDTGVDANDAAVVSSNEKRYVIRKSFDGDLTAWIPVETTMIANGFAEAWQSGALAYLEQGIIRSGLDSGWMQVIDVY